MNEQKDQDTMRKLLPTWRRVCLNVHETLRKGVEFVCIPFTWLLEQANGTADFRAAEARYDEAARKAKKQTA